MAMRGGANRSPAMQGAATHGMARRAEGRKPTMKNQTEPEPKPEPLYDTIVVVAFDEKGSAAMLVAKLGPVEEEPDPRNN